MKGILVLFCMMFFSFSAFSQAGVIIIQDSPAEELDRIDRRRDRLQAEMDRLQALAEAVRTAQAAIQTAEYQVRAAQSLAEGDWEGVVNAANYQAQTLERYTDILFSLEELGFSLDEGYLLDAQDFRDATRSSANLLNNVTQTAGSMQRRLETNKEISDRAKTAGTVEMLQLQSQQMGLLAGGLTDIQMMLEAGLKHEEYLTRIEVERELQDEEEFDKRMEYPEGLFESSVSEDDYQKLWRGGSNYQDPNSWWGPSPF